MSKTAVGILFNISSSSFAAVFAIEGTPYAFYGVYRFSRVAFSSNHVTLTYPDKSKLANTMTFTATLDTSLKILLTASDVIMSVVGPATPTLQYVSWEIMSNTATSFTATFTVDHGKLCFMGTYAAPLRFESSKTFLIYSDSDQLRSSNFTGIIGPATDHVIRLESGAMIVGNLEGSLSSGFIIIGGGKWGSGN
ncbi:hypothetical protein BD779DRAFT_1680831 [Infundibulicybe gibba]|nr:hypothetical protein BD779DRAFT_1680831 [Infundibulicybe gibba]